MVKLIDYDVKNGVIELFVSGYKNKLIIATTLSFEAFRYNEMAEKHGDRYAMENHDPSDAFSDLKEIAITHEEMQRFVDSIVHSDPVQHA